MPDLYHKTAGFSYPTFFLFCAENCFIATRGLSFRKCAGIWCFCAMPTMLLSLVLPIWTIVFPASFPVLFPLSRWQGVSKGWHCHHRQKLSRLAKLVLTHPSPFRRQKAKKRLGMPSLSSPFWDSVHFLITRRS